MTTPARRFVKRIAPWTITAYERMFVKRPFRMTPTMLFGAPISQTIYAIPLWEELFAKVGGPWRIIELGTGNGGFSTYLKICCNGFGARFLTYDVIPYQRTVLTEILNLWSSFRMLDVVAGEDEIAKAIRLPGRTLLYCDNGHKITEFNMYAKHLKPGDIIGTHDWGMEIDEQDVRQAVKENGLKHIQLDATMEREAYTRFYLKEV